MLLESTFLSITLSYYLLCFILAVLNSNCAAYRAIFFQSTTSGNIFPTHKHSVTHFSMQNSAWDVETGEPSSESGSTIWGLWAQPGLHDTLYLKSRKKKKKDFHSGELAYRQHIYTEPSFFTIWCKNATLVLQGPSAQGQATVGHWISATALPASTTCFFSTSNLSLCWELKALLVLEFLF